MATTETSNTGSRSTRKAWWGVGAIILATVAVSALGAAVSGGESDPWYQSLDKAPGNPPGFVFGIVWPVLYLLMIVSASRVWLRTYGSSAARLPMVLFGAQLVVNLAWSWLFFGLRTPLVALVDIVLLIMLVTAMTVAFHRISPFAAWLQAPYIAWLCFAAWLNGWIVFAN